MPPGSGARRRRTLRFFTIAAAIVLAAAVPPPAAPEYSAGEKAFIWLRTKRYEREYRRVMERGALLDLALARLKAGPAVWEDDFPAFQRERLERFIAGLPGAPKGDTICFGDSLLDLTRDRLGSVRPGLNFSVSGSWAHHMARMAEEMRTPLLRQGIYGSVRHVIVGSLGGNPLLTRQPVDLTIERSIDALKTMRRLYPGARFIVFGIPPTVSLYANLNAPAFELAIMNWVRGDRDAVFLPLQRRFAGKFGLYPRGIMSSDGVHFSREGAREFDRLLKKAKLVPPGTIVD